MSIFDSIDTPSDVKALPAENLDELCAQLREILIRGVSKTGGHLAANLGVVELTVAIHRVFDTDKDRLVFDVGHQSYVHKLLTGRKSGFETMRQFGGLAGFPKPSESVHDAFIAGHASTSISVALGMARARTLSRGEYSVVALIGDGALTGGLAFEGLSDAGESGEPMVIILNDNGMSITRNVGGVAHYLARQRMKPSYAAFKKLYRRVLDKIPGGRAIYRFTRRIKTLVKESILHCSMFEDMGLEYVGPVDGHNVGRITEALEWAKRQHEPTVVHVLTRKGKGYEPSELSPEEYHGVRPFDYRFGVTDSEEKSFSSVFGEHLCAIAQREPKLCAVTASMRTGTGLERFATLYPERFFDVGIAEGHAVAMAAGMASRGAIPVFAVYSTFLQRSYDMLVHDVAISGLHVVLAVNRGGLVPGDGETHQGVFDIGYLSSVPGMTVLCPASYAELGDMLRYAVDSVTGPVAVRFPRGGEGAYQDGGAERVKTIREGEDVTLVTYGVNVNTAAEAAGILENEGISVEIIKLGCVNPIETGDIEESVLKTGRLLVLEECGARGSAGESIAARLAGAGAGLKSLVLLNTGEVFAPCGDIDDLREMCGIDTGSVCEAVRRQMEPEPVSPPARQATPPARQSTTPARLTPNPAHHTTPPACQATPPAHQATPPARQTPNPAVRGHTREQNSA